MYNLSSIEMVILEEQNQFKQTEFLVRQHLRTATIWFYQTIW